MHCQQMIEAIKPSRANQDFLSQPSLYGMSYSQSMLCSWHCIFACLSKATDPWHCAHGLASVCIGFDMPLRQHKDKVACMSWSPCTKAMAGCAHGIAMAPPPFINYTSPPKELFRPFRIFSRRHQPMQRRCNGINK